MHWSREDTLDHWTRDLERWVPETMVAAPQRVHGLLDEHAFGASLEGRVDVARRHVVAAWADAATFGTPGRDLALAVDSLYPKLTGARGVREPTLGVTEVRMTSLVRDRGARPLDPPALHSWRQRERELGRSRSERSR